MADETPTPPSPTWAALRAGALSFVIGAAIAGGGAWYTLSQEKAAQAADFQSQIDTCSGQNLALEAQVASATNDKRILQVRVDLSRVADALEDSNFGTAKEHLEAARANYAAISPAPSAEFSSAMSAFTIQVTENLETQIERVNALGTQLDGMLSPN